jgi:ribosomal protein L37E
MIEKREECPRCGEVSRWNYDGQICAACDFGNAVTVPTHRGRALHAMAGHICSTRLTNGFCGPRDGRCHNYGADDPLRQHLNCMFQARGLMGAVETVGCKVVWAFDKQPSWPQKIENGRRAPDPGVDARERDVLRGPEV